MLRRLVVISALLLIVPASAGAVHFPNEGGCTDPGSHHGFCAALKLAGATGPYFELESFDGSGRYKLCLHAPHLPEVCVSRKLRYDPKASAWAARVLTAGVPIRSGGSYTARWIDPKSGHRLGPSLHVTILRSPGEEIPGLEETEGRA
jgi:hypothetical protein